jgi:hypothetical protein
MGRLPNPLELLGEDRAAQEQKILEQFEKTKQAI